MKQNTVVLLMVSIVILSFGIVPIGTGALSLPSLQDIVTIKDFLEGGPYFTEAELSEAENKVEEDYENACIKLEEACESECERIQSEWKDCDFKERYLEILEEKRDLRQDELDRWRDNKLKIIEKYRTKNNGKLKGY